MTVQEQYLSLDPMVGSTHEAFTYASENPTLYFDLHWVLLPSRLLNLGPSERLNSCQRGSDCPVPTSTF